MNLDMDPNTNKNTNKNTIFLIALLLAVVIIAGCSQAKNGIDKKGINVTIYKSELCGCCGLYINYLDDQGYNIKVIKMDDLTSLKEKYNIPSTMRSCHTAEVGGYFVEGHMPQEAIQKLLTDKPDIAGIALPGMPSGSPGMPGAKQGLFIIYAIGKDGTSTEFMRI